MFLPHALPKKKFVARKDGITSFCVHQAPCGSSSRCGARPSTTSRTGFAGFSCMVLTVCNQRAGPYASKVRWAFVLIEVQLKTSMRAMLILPRPCLQTFTRCAEVWMGAHAKFQLCHSFLIRSLRSLTAARSACNFRNSDEVLTAGSLSEFLASSSNNGWIPGRASNLKLPAEALRALVDVGVSVNQPKLICLLKRLHP